MQEIVKNQWTITAEGEYIGIWMEAFLVDRKAQNLSSETVSFYRKKLGLFSKFCDAQTVKSIEQITPDVIRRYVLWLEEAGHNAGGVHAMFRTLRAFLRWLDGEEVLPAGWKNPIAKVKAPKVAMEPIQGVPLADVSAMIQTCKTAEFAGARDRAILLTLLDTGARATEFCSVEFVDVDMATGSVLIRKGKGRKPRVVYICQKTRKALRAYLRLRRDNSSFLFVTVQGERLNYFGLRQILRRRAKAAGLKDTPSAHDFRRQFALSMLRNGADIFTLQRLLGHADLQVLRRYLAQTDSDNQTAHLRASPVENGL